jgi:hypothetical protein
MAETIFARFVRIVWEDPVFSFYRHMATSSVNVYVGRDMRVACWSLLSHIGSIGTQYILYFVFI